MNVHDFVGYIEVAHSLITFLVGYIPEYRQWYASSENLGIGLGRKELPKFYQNVVTSSGATLKEYRMGICTTFNGELRDRTLFESVLNQDEDVE